MSPRPRGVLLDIDGVLTTSWKELPGASAAVEHLRRREIPFRLLTNTTTHTRKDLAATLEGAGISVGPDEIVTAVLGASSYLREKHPGAKCFLLSDGDAREDLPGVELVEDRPDVVLIGGASDDFSYETLDRVFGWLMDGVKLVAMHRNMYWRTTSGLQLDSGAFVHGLEEAAGVEAAIVGKPSPAFFRAALEQVEAEADEAWMVGDDIVNDVLGAQAIGMTGVLVRSGKFRDGDLERERARPDHVIDSIAAFPALLDAS